MKAGQVAQVRGPGSGLGGGAPRNVGLDVARSAAILMVLVSHLATADGALSPRLNAMMETMGQAGVELFFSLSGFLIGGILLRMGRQGLTLGSVGRFMVRRWFRTLPLYALMLVAAGAWFNMDIRHSLLFLQNFYPAEPRALPVSWSLVMEEYFYIAFPLVMLALHAAGLRGAALVSTTAAGLIIFCVSLRLWNAYGFGPGWSAPYVHENPLIRLDCAAYGTLAAWLDARSPEKGASGWRWILLAGMVIAGLAAALLVWVLGASTDSLVAAGFLRWGAAFMALQTTALDTGFAMAVIGLARIHSVGPRPAKVALTWVSLISYSIYLVHVPIIGELARWTALGVPVRTAAAILMTFAISTITYHAVEQPFLRIRDALTGWPRSAP